MGTKKDKLLFNIGLPFLLRYLGFRRETAVTYVFLLGRLNQPGETSVECRWQKRNSPTFKTSVVKAGEVVLLLGCKTLCPLETCFL